MFFPIRIDRPNKRLPWVNYALIAANVIIFLLTKDDVAKFAPAIVRGYSLDQIKQALPVITYYLWPAQPHLYQFFTYQFLHESWMHLLGNMIFLWIFGNAVEDRLGKVGYLFFYLAGGVLAGVGFALTTSTPILGASGAIAAVTGAFLALFPLTNITIFFIFGWAFEVSALLLILFQVAENIVLQSLGVGHVAYTAHLTGYAFGFVVGMLLLVTRLVPREPYDMLSLIQQRHRRHQFRRMTQKGYHPWDVAGPSDPTSKPAAEPTPEEQALMQKRAYISQALAEHHPEKAASLYQDLLRDDPRQVMAQQQQLDLANQLMANGRYDTAAAAYELMLSHYPAYPQLQQVHLILGVIYARYLHRKPRAKEMLQKALPRLGDDDKRLAQQVLAELDGTSC